ncbi:zinc-ribbon and DUF3426 domain-containing protein [Massilia sp. YIM B02769]|uniref:zinc-ribbon and DUF3426 domain-containing protein n=1 Tax=Massilia sp. YIM B02769 TaxID=3050129 RepID=UPI0025B6D70F|nr:zinc-ribbon and DUF3426 domain-containing protein [Massilia sp. YIM B02769]MDN4057890.1 zinc-ribbon and DUF3426 domain-containing protein [Massilia sp. YIM B02769]
MALATQCPHCGTMFRVASDQLKLRGGIVRCGACQEIFDGSASLVDLDALPVRAPAQAAAPAAPAAPEAPALTETPAVVDVPAVPEIIEITEATEAPEAPADVAATPDLPVDADTPAAVAPEPAPAPAPAPAPEPEPEPEPEPVEGPAAAATPVGEAEAAPNFDDQPVYTLDFDHTFDPFGILPKVASPDEEPLPDAMPGEAEPQVNTAGDTAQELTPPAFAPATEIAYPPSGRIEPSFDLPVDEEIVATALPDHDHEQEQEREPAAKAVHAADAPAILPMREAAGAIIHATTPAPSAPPVARTPSAKRADKAAARRSRLTPTRIDAPPKIRVPESDEPEFVKRSRQQEQSGRTRKIAMLAGSIVLLLILLAQGAFTFRSALAARFPGAKPALVSGCALFGCRVDLPAQVDNLVIDTGELTTLGGGAYAFTTQLRNQGAVPQAWPSLELSLTDANDKPLVRRVFAPRDYLVATTPTANGLAPRVEQAITLHFRVDDLQPSGYHIAVFYP